MPARIHFDNKTCLQCGDLFNRGKLRSGRDEAPEDFRKRKFCGKKCYVAHNVGINHPTFKPEGSVRKDGYVRVARAGRRVYLHREVMEKKLGRKLDSSEHVHHKDENPGHNSKSNLKLASNSEHRKIHNKTAPRNAAGQYSKA